MSWRENRFVLLLLTIMVFPFIVIISVFGLIGSVVWGVFWKRLDHVHCSDCGLRMKSYSLLEGHMKCGECVERSIG